MEISMRRTSLILLSSFLFLLCASLVAYLLRFCDLGGAVTYLIIGVALLFLSSIIAYFSAELIPLNVLCFAMSAAALGFLIRCWYAFRNFDNTLGVMLLVCVACVLHLLLFRLVAELPLLRKHRVAVAVIYGVLSLFVYLYVMLSTTTTYVSTFGYYMIVEIAFLYALIMPSEDRASLIRQVTLCTFSVFGVAVILAVMIFLGDGADCDLSGCDCGCDCGSGEGRKKKGKPSGAVGKQP